MVNTTRIPLPAWAVTLLGAVFLLLPACYNHYPMVDPDAGTYIASGFKLDTPMDRPITYGLLVRLLSINGLSLWGVVVVQALLLSWLLQKVMQLVVGKFYSPLTGLFILLFLSQFTALPWLACMIHPDIFTAVACLVLVLLLGSQRVGWWYYLLFWVAVAVHMSHPLLLAAVVLMLLVFRRSYARVSVRPVSYYFILIAIAFSAIAIMGSAISKSKHVFFTGTLVEKGVLPVYLQEQCGHKNYRLCAYKDKLPKTSDAFVWLNDSPLYQVGDWAGSKAEFTEIDKDIMTTPRYLWMFIKASAVQFYHQLNTFDIGTGTFRFQPGSNVHQQISMYLPRERASFECARQNLSDLPAALNWVNLLLRAIVYASAFALTWFIIAGWGSMPSALRLLVIVTIGGYIINCADFAALSTLIGRYSAKMVWLVPFTAILCLYNAVNKDGVSTSKFIKQ